MHSNKIQPFHSCKTQLQKSQNKNNNVLVLVRLRISDSLIRDVESKMKSNLLYI